MIACHQFMDIPSEISENCLNKLAKNQQREREVRELLEYIYIYIHTKIHIFIILWFMDLFFFN